MLAGAWLLGLVKNYSNFEHQMASSAISYEAGEAGTIQERGLGGEAHMRHAGRGQTEQNMRMRNSLGAFRD